jgi:hypothetical protein
MAKNPAINHPILDELWRADKEAAKRFQSDFDPGLGRVGLIMKTALKHREYDWCTPVNCWTFAATGGDGVHFSLLARREVIWEDAPVVMTTPAAGGGVSCVVGENLFDFLCLGSTRGYFALEQLVYESAMALRAYTDPAWRSSDRFTVAQDEQRILDFLTERFRLRPWTCADHFYELQERYIRQLELPPDCLWCPE